MVHIQSKSTLEHECLEDFLEYDRDHPNNIDPIREVLKNRRSDGAVLMGDPECGNLMRKKDELLKRISSQREWVFKKIEEARMADQEGYNPYYPSRDLGADFSLD